MTAMMGSRRILFPDSLVVIRGGGDLATGVALRLFRSGFPVIVLELAHPLTVRRRVALSSSVHDGDVVIEGVRGVSVSTVQKAVEATRQHVIPVLVDPTLVAVQHLAAIVVDARLAKRNIDTTIDDAAFVVGLGPGFTPGIDCHVAIETMRGPRLGRALWDQAPAANTGQPGEIGGKGSERVLRAPSTGAIDWLVEIGQQVVTGQCLGSVGDAQLLAPFDGVIRGLIMPGTTVPSGLKVGDIDPRLSGVRVDEVSDKALAIGGGVLESVLQWLTTQSVVESLPR